MSEEMVNSETNSADGIEGETADRQTSEMPIAGEIVSGTWVNPTVPNASLRREALRRDINYRLTEAQPSLVRAIFGGVVILTEELGEWASLEDEDDLTRQMVEAAVHQAIEQQESNGDRPFADLRYGAIGLLGGALDAAQTGAGRVSGIAGTAAQAASKIIDPVWNSFLFAPFHEPILKVEKAGEEKVNAWIRRGRIEEVRSRTMAEVGISNFVEDSVTELTENAQVQMIVQQVIASQSTGVVTQILEEIRERFVSLDLLLLNKLRREPVAAPDFRDAYVSQLAERRSRYLLPELNRSLAGTYAGPLGRFAAFVIDLTILILAAGLISSFISATLALFGLTDIVVSYLLSGRLVSSIILFLILMANFLLIGFYFVLSWNLIGSTPGDLVMGLRVVKTDGENVSFWRSFLRLIGAVVSAVFLFIGFIWALFDRRRQGWHDKVGGTFVLYDWPAKPEEEFLHEQVMVGFEPEARRVGQQ